MKVYLVEYNNFDEINEEHIHYPMKAFVSETDAEVYAQQCRDELDRIQFELGVYWDEHKEEYEELCRKQRNDMRQGHMESWQKDSKEELRKQSLMDAAVLIENSHKFHPDYPVYLESDIQYEVTPLELVEDET
jgi:hypothetical protein